MSRYQEAEEELNATGYLIRQKDGYWKSRPDRAAFQETVALFLIRTGKAKTLISTLRGKPMLIAKKDD